MARWRDVAGGDRADFPADLTPNGTRAASVCCANVVLLWSFARNRSARGVMVRTGADRRGRGRAGAPIAEGFWRALHGQQSWDDAVGGLSWRFDRPFGDVAVAGQRAEIDHIRIYNVSKVGVADVLSHDVYSPVTNPRIGARRRRVIRGERDDDDRRATAGRGSCRGAPRRFRHDTRRNRGGDGTGDGAGPAVDRARPLRVVCAIRVQLRAAMAKNATNRQSELVALVSALFR